MRHAWMRHAWMRHAWMRHAAGLRRNEREPRLLRIVLHGKPIAGEIIAHLAVLRNQREPRLLGHLLLRERRAHAVEPVLEICNLLLRRGSSREPQRLDQALEIENLRALATPTGSLRLAWFRSGVGRVKERNAGHGMRGKPREG